MSIQWQEYDQFDWDRAHQDPMKSEERSALETVAAGLLGLSQPQQARAWGMASPPGRYAATVIRVFAGIPHRYSDQAQRARIEEIGVKLFKTTPDARREARKVLPFHRETIHCLPGLPNDHVQKTLGGGTVSDDRGGDREYVIQEWAPGVTLEELTRQTASVAPMDGGKVRSLLEQLFAEIIIPLWAAGTIWWDVRDANYCWNDALGRLTLIDVDSLAAYADEITQTPQRWERREKGRGTALARLRQMTLRLLLTQGGGRKKSEVGTRLEHAWQTRLEPALRGLGRDRWGDEAAKSEALAALDGFLDELSGAGLLPGRR